MCKVDDAVTAPPAAAREERSSDAEGVDPRRKRRASGRASRMGGGGGLEVGGDAAPIVDKGGEFQDTGPPESQGREAREHAGGANAGTMQLDRWLDTLPTPVQFGVLCLGVCTCL